MKATAVLSSQLAVVHRMFIGATAGLTLQQWHARPAQGANLVGFVQWHIATAQDWSFRTAILGRPMVRQQEPWVGHPGINADLPPFGMTLDEADAIAYASTPADVAAYQRDVHMQLTAWLESLDDADLDTIPPIDIHARTLPAHLVTDGYLEEVESMNGWTIARFLSSPCIGHARAHLGELDLVRQVLGWK
jgi:hypothetical protein